MESLSSELKEDKLSALTELSKGSYQAYLYDCDGTLADNMQAHKDTYVKVAAEKGVELDGAIIDELAGWPIPAVVAEINRRYQTTFDPYEFEQRKYELFYNEYIEQVTPVQFVVDHLKCHTGKVKIGVVSGGSTAAITKTLKVLGISDRIDVLVCAGDTEKGKPYPDPFLLAASKLGIDPGACLVFEDGQPGVQAAESAGMDWIRIDKI